jgi:sulfur carrier protein
MGPAKSRWRCGTSFDTRSRVRVRLNPEGRCVDLDGAKRVSDLLSRLNILPGTVLVIRGDKLLTEDAPLAASDDIELRSVVSGG